jgi:hypothetical protein
MRDGVSLPRVAKGFATPVGLPISRNTCGDRRGQSAFTVARASGFLYAAGDAGGRRALVLQLLRNPREVLGVALVIRRLPTVPVRLSDSHNGRSLRERFGRRLLGLRVACLGQAVLRMPPTFADYLSGRSRRAVRTNLSKARAVGLLVKPLPEDADQKRLTEEVESRRPPREWWIALGTRGIRDPELRWFGVFDTVGHVLGVAAVCVDVEWAHLQLLTCVTDDDRAFAARYLLHTHLVEELIASGVRYLNSDSGLRVAPGVRYLQHVLGYEVMNLRLRGRTSPVPHTFR